MKVSNMMKILECTTLAMLLLCLTVLPSIAETSTNVCVVDRTDDFITVVDKIGRTVTVNLPVEHIIATDYRQMDILLALGAGDMIVGVDKTFHDRMPYFGLSDVPEVSVHSQEVNYEYVLMLNPDLVIAPTSQGASAEEISSKLLGVPVLVLSMSHTDVVPITEMLGEVLDKEDEADRLIGWMNSYNNIVEERTKDLDPQENPTYFYGSVTSWRAYKLDAADGCGGTDIAADLPSNSDVSSEWILSVDPDYIFLDDMRSDISGYRFTEDDVKNNLDTLIGEREGFSDLSATKNNHVYLLHRDWVSQPRWIAGHVCIAKWLHPDLFEDLSPAEIQMEYFREFHGIEPEGTWAYPIP